MPLGSGRHGFAALEIEREYPITSGPGIEERRLTDSFVSFLMLR